MGTKPPRKRKSSDTDDDGVSARASKAPKRPRIAFLVDSAVKTGGTLSCRLDCTLDHLPEPAKPYSRCSLHRWAASVETTKAMLYCPACNVTLGSSCYKKFHVIEDLLAAKDDLKHQLAADKDDITTTTTPRHKSKGNNPKTPRTNSSIKQKAAV